jgi:hypothetical protein
VIIKRPGGPEVDVNYGNPSTLFTNAGALLDMIDYGHVPPLEHETQFYRYLFGTKLYHNPSTDDPRFHYTIPTRYLRRRIADHFRKMMMEERFALLAKFAPLPQVAGIFYESIALDILQDPDRVSDLAQVFLLTLIKWTQLERSSRTITAFTSHWLVSHRSMHSSSARTRLGSRCSK